MEKNPQIPRARVGKNTSSSFPSCPSKYTAQISVTSTKEESEILFDMCTTLFHP